MKPYLRSQSRLAGLPLSLSLLTTLPLVFSTGVLAQEESPECGTGLVVDHAFSSGASWSVCLSENQAHGLELSHVYYRAPGDTQRSVLDHVHLAQVLLHYHDSAQPEAQIDGQISRSTDGQVDSPLADSQSADLSTYLQWNQQTCDGAILDIGDKPASVCSRIKNNRILAKYAQRPSVQSESLEFSAAFQRGALVWTVLYTLTEDGTVRPALSLSGRADNNSNDPRFAQTLATDNNVANDDTAGSVNLTRATVLSTWRMVFDLDTPSTDSVEQFEFPLDEVQGNRRPMEVVRIETESLRQVDREKFTGWRLLDNSGAGYYLDPANSGFRYTSNSMNWAQFDVAVTAYNDCEIHALMNQETGLTDCGRSLDDFVDGESMQDRQPVLWYSLSRTFQPSREDWPVIRNLFLSFDLLPFDWTATSPFEVIE